MSGRGESEEDRQLKLKRVATIEATRPEKGNGKCKAKEVDAKKTKETG